MSGGLKEGLADAISFLCQMLRKSPALSTMPMAHTLKEKSSANLTVPVRTSPPRSLGGKLTTAGGPGPRRACRRGPDRRDDVSSLQQLLDALSSLFSQLHVHERAFWKSQTVRDGKNVLGKKTLLYFTSPSPRITCLCTHTCAYTHIPPSLSQ